MIYFPFRTTALSLLLAASTAIAEDSAPAAAPSPAEEPAPATAPSEPAKTDGEPKAKKDKKDKEDKPKADKPKAEKPKVTPFEEVDTDKDGGVTEEEFYEQVVTQTFVFHDKDQDSTVADKEAKKHAKKVKKEAPADPAATSAPDAKETKKKPAKASMTVAIPFVDVDGNGNSKLTREEIKVAVRNNKPQFQTVFQLLDSNKDSKITADEWTKYSDQQAKSGGGVPIFRFSF